MNRTWITRKEAEEFWPSNPNHKRNECCKLIFIEYGPEFIATGMKNGYKYLKEDGSECEQHNKLLSHNGNATDL